MMAQPVLVLKNLTKWFGGLQVINDVNLSFRPGELRCIIGPNGAGKTTLFNMITGRVKPDQGQIVFEGRDITRLKPYEISRTGIALKFQVPTVFDELTIHENLNIAARGPSPASRAVGKKSVPARIEEVMEVVHLAGREEEVAGTLSHGERQWLEIGMVLAYRPKVMLLDEPTAGMSTQETIETSHIIRTISHDTTTIVIEHDIKFLREIAENVTVIHQGAVIAEGTFQEVSAIDLVRDIYLGRRG
jgi:urea ABC transporter ATP-binding protein UrtD